MQTSIAIALLATACIYLLWHFLPRHPKHNVLAWLKRHVPNLAKYIEHANPACSDGCHNCGDCPPDRDAQHNEKIMSVHRKL